MIWSPLTMLPSSSTARQRSASPSKATPIMASEALTMACSCSGWVEPAFLLML